MQSADRAAYLVESTVRREDGINNRSAVELREIMNVLLEKKWTISLSTLLMMIVAGAATFFIPSSYEAVVVLSPAEESDGGGLNAMLSQFSGLTSLAGVKIDAGKANKTVVGVEIIKSRAFIEKFISERDLLVPLMAAKGWDRKNRNLLIDESDYDLNTGNWVRKVTPPFEAKPSLWEAYKEFREIMSIIEDKQTGLITIALKHKSPVLARDWVLWLVEDVNELMRQRDIDEAQKSIDYLHHQLKKTAVAEMQRIFYQLVEKQQQTIMLASVRDQYVFEMVSPPMEPVEAVGPKRLVIVFLVGLASMFFVVFLVLLNGVFFNGYRGVPGK